MKKRRGPAGGRGRPTPRPDSGAGRDARATPRPAARGDASPLSRLAALLALPALWLVTALVHAPALRTFFAADDLTFLARARGLEPEIWSFARLLSGAPRWHAMNALFGLDPLPYHALNFALHLANVTLVYFVGRRLLGGRGAAFAAALLFGTSTIAFTPLHWATGMGEILVATFSLAALRVHLLARERESNTLPWATAALVLGAMLSKESAVLLPLVLLVADRRMGFPAPRARALWPSFGVAVAFALAFVASLGLRPYLGGEAYAMTLAPGFVAKNLATYLSWLVQPQVAVRDAIASASDGAWLTGALVALVIAIALWLQRRDPRHPQEVGAAWLALFLVPVLPLAHHTYLYYLYLPWIGGCWLIAGAVQRLLGRRRAIAFAVGTLGLAGFAWLGFAGGGARERAMTGDFPADRTVREARMLRNAVASLDSARLAPGAAVGFVNPAPYRHSSLAGDVAATYVYIPLQSAFRGGEALALFVPGTRYLGFAGTVPPEWDEARLFSYHDDGTLESLGAGGPALAEVGYRALRLHQFGRADTLFARAMAHGDTLPDATFGLIVTREQLGHHAESRAFGELFLRRWPSEPRADVVRSQLGIRR